MENADLLLFGHETERLTFRELLETDFNEWMKFCEDPSSLKYIRPTGDESAEEKCKFWFQKVFHRYNNNLGGMNVLVEKNSGQIVGQCGLLIQTVDDIEELEIGYSLMPAQRGKGYALEAARKCRDYAFENRLRESLISIIHIDNEKSKNVALSNGMQEEKRSLFNSNPVIIFRISRSDWLRIK